MSLEVRNITFKYEKAKLCTKHIEANSVLTNFSAEFPAGQVTALTGSNGAGKTTLARIIMGIISPNLEEVAVTNHTRTDGHTMTTGHTSTDEHTTATEHTSTAENFAVPGCFLDGQCIDNRSLAQRGRAIGYVMQNPAKQIFSQTCIEEVEYGLHNLGILGAKATVIAEEYLDKFGMLHHRDDFPFALSHGEKQRLVLAAILAMKPKYLILDEPTASLDAKSRKKLGEILRTIADSDTPDHAAAGRGCGVIVISHDKKFIEEYCDSEIQITQSQQREKNTNIMQAEGNAQAERTVKPKYGAGAESRCK